MELRIGPDTDWEEAVAALAAENLRRRQARGEPASAAASQNFAVRRLDAAFRAARLGHVVVWDPPAGLTSVRARWTCTRRMCGAAVLVSAEGGVYGKAAAEACLGG
jgi:hypothetical protein